MFGRRKPQSFTSRAPYMMSPDQYLDRLGEGSPYNDESEPPRRRRRIGRVITVIVVVILLGILAYGAYIASIVVKVSSNPFSLAALASDNGRTNVLILGTGDPGHAGQELSDTVMVLSYDAATKRTAQISLPRDLQVQIPGYGQAKINQANALGGQKLAAETVANVLDLPVHYVVSTDFSGLKGLVDAVGGIDVTVAERLADPEYPCDDDQYKVCGLDIAAGPTHMDGTLALKYVRCRKGTCGNDFGRAARQQEVTNLVRSKLVDPKVLLNPGRLVPVVTALRDSLSTDMGAVQLAELAYGWQAGKDNQPVQLVLSTAPGGYLVSARGSSNLLPADGTFTAIRARVKAIFTEQDSSPTSEQN